ncbi:MAG: fluoride efflux transporter CrcB [Muribaculaceae bacterium]|nr:fluoride efflux transporter CrcB [Muribaculaceae bacterium]
MSPYLCVALGGALGAVSRYTAGSLPVAQSSPHLRTAVINIAGCLVIGILWAVIDSFHLSRVWYNILIAGFLGGFTTYSSFSLETIRLVADGRLSDALVYIGLTLLGCLGACALGLYATSHILNHHSPAL